MAEYDNDPEGEGEGEGEEFENEGWGPSLYNDNKGIKMTLQFTPLFAPPEAGKKRRANAKPPITTRIEYFHEDVPLRAFLIKTLTSIKRQDLFESSWLFQGRELDRDDCFTLSYTIPRWVTDQVIISDEKDYKEMVNEALSKSPHGVKVYVIENQIGGGEDDPDEEAEHEEVAGSRKKQKTNLPSKEETAQVKIIQELERRHRCEDKQCGMTPCYDGKIEGVNQENPPHSKIFDPPTNKHRTDDVALLARRRIAQNREAAAPAITVNFPGFADVFRAPNAAPMAGGHPVAPVPINSPRCRAPPPPMTLVDFCHLHQLGGNIKGKLDAIHITGPHVLRLVSDADLRGDGGLDVGEVASVRDAQQRWIHSLAQPAA